MALGWPVSEKGPEPGRPIFPVARWRLWIALFLPTPAVLWLTPMLHRVIAFSARPKIFAAFIISGRGRPQSWASGSGGALPTVACLPAESPVVHLARLRSIR